MKRLIAIAALSAAMTGMSACASLEQGATPAQQRAARYVVVNNTHLLDVAVYATRSGIRQRIGTVTGLSSARLRLPSWATPDGSVRLLVDPIGSSQTWQTDPIILGPNQELELRVTRLIDMSTYTVRSY